MEIGVLDTVKNQIEGLFKNFLDNEGIFINKKVLQSNYTPENIPHREELIEQIVNILSPALKLNKPSNLFLYGKTGTGKTLCVKYIANKITEITNQKNIPIKILYLNCKLKRIADTEYRLIAQIAREFGKAIPPTGLPTDEVYRIFFNAVNEKEQLIIIVLDEIDQLVTKAGDEILYNLTRINSDLTKSQISLIGISNDLVFTENMDPRVKSSLSEEEVVFPPYNALQIQDILNQRAKKAFKHGALEQGVIEKCAAYAAREHGDARRALELLRVAGELAEREGSSKVKIVHIDAAEDKIERDRILDVIVAQPKQFQATLYSILKIYPKRKSTLYTGDIYEYYKGLCTQIGLRPLTQRRISDIVAELDMLGIINARVISKGRYGRTREISLAIHPSTEAQIKKILESDLNLN